MYVCSSNIYIYIRKEVDVQKDNADLDTVHAADR